MTRFLVLLILAATSIAQAGWDTLDNCRPISSDWNDGDSFHVRHAGKEYIFRLCYVDTPESKGRKGQTRRTSDQARYWKILKRDMYPLAKEASAYTATVMAGSFTVKTEWEDAKGSSQLPRYFGVIITPQGDLAELLVAHGYARIYGFSPDYPGGIKAAKYGAKLEGLEANAREKKLGAWAFSKKSKSSRKKTTKKTHSSGKTKPLPPPEDRKQGLNTLPVF